MNSQILLVFSVAVWVVLGLLPEAARPAICVVLGPLGCDISSSCAPYCHLDNVPIPVRDVAGIAAMLAAYLTGLSARRRP